MSIKIFSTFMLFLSLFSSYLKADELFKADHCSKIFLIYGGKTGWIGQQLVAQINHSGYLAVAGEARLENREAVEREIARVSPDYIINAAGVTGCPNVDWCEDHKQETIRTNMTGVLTLADIALKNNIHLTNIGTGCIYEYDSEHPQGSGIGFKEEDTPNFDGSFYSKTKGMLDFLLTCYPNVLNLRLRMPISSDLNPRSFITKITKYEKVINIPNSMSILDDLIPLMYEMPLRGLVGNYNFTNPGTLSHNEILALYKKYIDPEFRWENFSIEEQDRILKAKRSNNELDVSKLLKEFPDLPSAKDSIIRVFLRMKDNLRKS
jgi:3,5-epimerase/4-reductase